MTHADASNFAENVTKKEAYSQVLEQAAALFEGQQNWVCNLANTASLIWHAHKSMSFPSNQTNWAGFYVLDPSKKDQLILGPFMGKVACQTIRFGQGVCGKAMEARKTIIVPDVNAFPGHIACDGDTKSEIVVPIISHQDKVVGVIDCDSTAINAFDSEDQQYLERVAELLSSACTWSI
ncbi:GAF domain nucleotide-binding protein [Kalaharituber pfeilii]|nr:GAF domain nucleotide-binding protein [Kalaharituber pfeilii]